MASPEDVAAAIEDNEPGDSVTVEFLRGRTRESVDIELGTRPAQAGGGSQPGGGPTPPGGGLSPPEDDGVLPLP